MDYFVLYNLESYKSYKGLILLLALTTIFT